MLQLRSLVTADGTLELSLAEVETPAPGAGEILVRIDATPINPSDIGLLFGAADMTAATVAGTPDRPVVTAPIPPALMRAMAARVGESMPVGNEAGGVVVAAGEGAEHLVGKTVGIIGGAMYAQFRTVRARDAIVAPDGVDAEAAASCFVNPLTALGMTETMRREGHKALVHTAAASNLGQMLNRICIKDGIALINIVRSAAQAATLRDLGAAHVVDSSQPGFMDALVAALVETGATIAFDAIGGGKLAGQILTAMEIAVNKTAREYSRYGSAVHKQVYIYGGLDTGPTELNRGFGMAWGIGGWLLFPFLQKIGAADAQALRDRVAAELTTTFASHYTARITLAEALGLPAITGYNRRATGEKYLITPNA
ncbi:zinc-binding dehydrogenase [Polymorphobacter fuscus]|uniref:NADH oxidase n=1 Tax=Sandarakinorhabdus fusca TaxID=1439888 RepID=A0A7C9KW64_9SPHN|nr:zinc-binding dehydrogenase [Polymorphobacter fuscus]KAB7648840.1 NADH oxidase [Polymorphobacter fuscus]MQT16422.1 NADH oxidase [Polymorphobacter fuscus]NJC07288.1 NADPH:quinone reductase-like Zn-dependent oxidoreductase [Polymorphobacter fuscus]